MHLTKTARERNLFRFYHMEILHISELGLEVDGDLELVATLQGGARLGLDDVPLF